jgi:hypothetical protein
VQMTMHDENHCLPPRGSDVGSAGPRPYGRRRSTTSAHAVAAGCCDFPRSGRDYRQPEPVPALPTPSRAVTGDSQEAGACRGPALVGEGV